MEVLVMELWQRQTAAFERYLQMMVNRRKKVKPGDSFIIFQDEDPSAPEDQLSDQRARSLALVAADGREIGSERDAPQAEASTDSDGSGSWRYVQLCFMQQSFYLELPCATLMGEEGRQLIVRRPGFYYLRERRPGFYSLEGWKKVVKEWNPVWKQYINSDTRTAAADIAFIWLGLWRYPPDWQFWYRACTFDDNRHHDWEGDFPVRLEGQQQ